MKIISFFLEPPEAKIERLITIKKNVGITKSEAVVEWGVKG